MTRAWFSGYWEPEWRRTLAESGLSAEAQALLDLGRFGSGREIESLLLQEDGTCEHLYWKLGWRVPLHTRGAWRVDGSGIQVECLYGLAVGTSLGALLHLALSDEPNRFYTRRASQSHPVLPPQWPKLPPEAPGLRIL